jgi:hypothetical protein
MFSMRHTAYCGAGGESRTATVKSQVQTAAAHVERERLKADLELVYWKYIDTHAMMIRFARGEAGNNPETGL